MHVLRILASSLGLFSVQHIEELGIGPGNEAKVPSGSGGFFAWFTEHALSQVLCSSV